VLCLSRTEGVGVWKYWCWGSMFHECRCRALRAGAYLGPCAGPRLPCPLSPVPHKRRMESLSSVALSLAGDRGRGRGRGLTGLGLSRLPPSHTVSCQSHTAGKPPISFLLSIGGLVALLNPALVWSALPLLSLAPLPPYYSTSTTSTTSTIWPGPLNGR